MVMFPIRSPFVLFLIRSRSVLFPVCSLAGFRSDPSVEITATRPWKSQLGPDPSVEITARAYPPSEEITAKVYTPSEEIIGITYGTILQRGIDNQRITC